MTKPFISVIVPIYNVVPYLRKCLNSLVNQTLKQIEVICIDDGSTDQSGKIAEEYITDAGVWPIFRVLHNKNNRGLSAARNRGIEVSASSWIMFVDSDDWVDPDFCRIPYEACKETRADLVIFDYYNVKRGKTRIIDKKIKPSGILDELTAHEYGGIEVWNKLYKRDLFENNRFPEGRVHEDIYITHKLVHESQRIERINERLYFHCERKGSISHTNSATNKKDNFEASIKRYEDLISYGYPADKLSNSIYGDSIGYLASTRTHKDELYKKARRIVDSIEGMPNTLTNKQKIALRVWRMNENAFYIVSMIAGRVGKT